MPAIDLTTAVGIDLLVVFACILAFGIRGGTRHSHPAVIYLIFHLLVVTSRAVAVANGAPTFLTGSRGYDPPDQGEMARAILVADLALVAATAGWLTQLIPRSRARTPQVGCPLAWRPLHQNYLGWVAVVAVPIGVLTIARYGYLPGSETGDYATSSYATLALTWPGLVLLGFIYVHGFKFVLLVPMVGYLMLIALQGYGRFRVIIPIILLFQIALDRRGRRWPRATTSVLLVATLLLFFPLKAIGRGVQAGEDFSAIRQGALSNISDAARGQAGDQVILDQLALTLSLTDDSRRIFLGRPYLNVLVLPVPREVWKDKPGLADHLADISQSTRPLAQVGAVTTLPGDLYLNFRLPGLIVVMFGLARLSGRLFEAAYRRPYLSVARFAYLLLACNLIQIYRDGPISVPLFLLVQMLPLVVVVLLHRHVPRVQAADTEPPGDLDGPAKASGLHADRRARWMASKAPSR